MKSVLSHAPLEFESKHGQSCYHHEEVEIPFFFFLEPGISYHWFSFLNQKFLLLYLYFLLWHVSMILYPWWRLHNSSMSSFHEKSELWGCVLYLVNPLLGFIVEQSPGPWGTLTKCLQSMSQGNFKIAWALNICSSDCSYIRHCINGTLLQCIQRVWHAFLFFFFAIGKVMSLFIKL